MDISSALAPNSDQRDDVEVDELDGGEVVNLLSLSPSFLLLAENGMMKKDPLRGDKEDGGGAND